MRLVETAEMGIGANLDPHRRGHARLVVQGAVCSFGRLLEASRGEMSDSDIRGVEKGQRIERAQTARPFDGFDRRVGLVAMRPDIPSGQRGVSRVRVERQGAIERRRRHRRLAGEDKQRPGSLPNRFGVIARGFERLSGQAAGFGDVVGSQRSPPLNPLLRPTPPTKAAAGA